MRGACAQSAMIVLSLRGAAAASITCWSSEAFKAPIDSSGCFLAEPAPAALATACLRDDCRTSRALRFLVTAPAAWWWPRLAGAAAPARLGGMSRHARLAGPHFLSPIVLRDNGCDCIQLLLLHQLVLCKAQAQHEHRAGHSAEA